MVPEKEELVITKLKDGTVIDHIPAGKSLDILNALGLLKDKDRKIAAIMCVESRKLGKKDLLKIEGYSLESRVLEGKIAIIAPGSNISIIKDYKVISKHEVSISDRLVSTLRCINSNCISNAKEDIKSRFDVLSRNPLKVRCHYCERTFCDDGIVVDV